MSNEQLESLIYHSQLNHKKLALLYVNNVDNNPTWERKFTHVVVSKKYVICDESIDTLNKKYLNLILLVKEDTRCL